MGTIKFILTGNLGKDAEVKTASNGKQYMIFSIPVEDGYGDNKKTIWWNCSAFSEFNIKKAEWLKKGAIIQVQGRMDLRVFEDRISHNLIADSIDIIKFADKNGTVNQAPAQNQAPEPNPAPTPAPKQEFDSLNNDDDLPF